MSQEEYTIQMYGEEVVITLGEQLNAGKRRIDLEHEDGRKWRIVVTGSGKLHHVETTWRDGQLADLDEPEWLDDLLARMARPA